MQATSPVTVVQPGEGSWRLFVALRVPEEVKIVLEQVQRELRALISPGGASWPKPDHLHLTLRFLGEVDCRRIDEIKARLQLPIGMFGRMELTCERLGCFPNPRHPTVVWAWVHDDEERLTALQRIIEIATESFTQQPAEGRFIGHVTLARLKRCRRSEAERMVHFIEGAIGRYFGSWTVKEIELIRSELSPTGSRYTTLARFPLGG